MNLSLILLLLAPQSSVAKPKFPVAPVASSIVLEIEGKIFPKDQLPESCKTLFQGVKCDAPSYGQIHIQSKQEGDLIHSISIFSDPDGPQVTEESWEKNGHFTKAFIENRATKKRMEIEVRGDKIQYTVTNHLDGSIKTSEDDNEPNLVVPSTVMAYIRPQFLELASGKEVKLRVAVMDRREAFSFVIKKIREEKTSTGEDVMVLQMAPTSIIVKALVDPMFFYVKPKSGEMFAFQGKSALRMKEGNQYKEMNVTAAYFTKINQFKVAAGKVGSQACTSEMMKLNSVKCSVTGIKEKDESNENKTSVQN